MARFCETASGQETARFDELLDPGIMALLQDEDARAQIALGTEQLRGASDPRVSVVSMNAYDRAMLATQDAASFVYRGGAWWLRTPEQAETLIGSGMACVLCARGIEPDDALFVLATLLRDHGIAAPLCGQCADARAVAGIPASNAVCAACARPCIPEWRGVCTACCALRPLCAQRETLEGPRDAPSTEALKQCMRELLKALGESSATTVNYGMHVVNAFAL